MLLRWSLTTSMSCEHWWQFDNITHSKYFESIFARMLDDPLPRRWAATIWVWTLLSPSLTGSALVSPWLFEIVFKAQITGRAIQNWKTVDGHSCAGWFLNWPLNFQYQEGKRVATTNFRWKKVSYWLNKVFLFNNEYEEETNKICEGRRRFLTISDPRWDQPISDIFI